ncbi:hypothetical protein [Mesoplasma lactucae]|uniref:Uncharacterized protein n=1 Tax=Mesoplasma lactucae ATCC 49193 TaxID=81460 RepID=A0A291ISJ1_9MOLU|nr:hypothetical protein [Mesoplasma lactucae]ATG97676.1 hypothetical protein CP520_02970 [Mesoplasma lactucae ATCC 49193]ATZ19859.1 hypothetical protein MLACT_v1c00340 [Mesoplasma lactucae ATCC 49193]MCL8216722.1 hypothetical protein [Mesoplasma lactucae ATCC 49193]
MEKRIENYWNQMEEHKLTFAEFLRNSKVDLGLVELKFDTTNRTMTAIYGDEDETLTIEAEEFPTVKEYDAIDLSTVIVPLKQDFAKLLNDEAYHGELGEFLDKYHLTSMDFNMQNDEVTFRSGNSHLVEGVDYDAQ